MKKQTAIEWLMSQFLEGSIEPKTGNLYIKIPKKAFEKAKAMEREQIENAWHAGVSDSDDAKSYYNDHYRATSEKYYNETYKGGEQ